MCCGDVRMAAPCRTLYYTKMSPSRRRGKMIISAAVRCIKGLGMAQVPLLSIYVCILLFSRYIFNGLGFSSVLPATFPHLFTCASFPPFPLVIDCCPTSLLPFPTVSSRPKVVYFLPFCSGDNHTFRRSSV